MSYSLSLYKIKESQVAEPNEYYLEEFILNGYEWTEELEEESYIYDTTISAAVRTYNLVFDLLMIDNRDRFKVLRKEDYELFSKRRDLLPNSTEDEQYYVERIDTILEHIKKNLEEGHILFFWTE